MWEHNGQGPWEREAEEKLGGKVTWFHTISAAFSFPSSFSPPPLAQPTPPSIFLGTNSKATRFGQRKGGVDISWLPQCNGGRQSWKPRLTSSTASSLMSAFNTETTSPPNRSESGCSYLYLYSSFQGIWMSKDTSNFSSTPLVLPFHVGSTGFRRNVWLCRIFFSIFKEDGLIIFPPIRFYKRGRTGRMVDMVLVLMSPKLSLVLVLHFPAAVWPSSNNPLLVKSLPHLGRMDCMPSPQPHFIRWLDGSPNQN